MRPAEHVHDLGVRAVAQGVVDSSDEVANRNRVILWVSGELVAPAMHLTALDAAARQYRTVDAGPVIAPGLRVGIGPRRAAELPGPDHQRFRQQGAISKV